MNSVLRALGTSDADIDASDWWRYSGIKLLDWARSRNPMIFATSKAGIDGLIFAADMPGLWKFVFNSPS